MNNTILAIDLGKYKSVVCLYDKISNQAGFETITTMRHALVELIQRHRPGVVVIEACALCGWVHDSCAEIGVAVKVAARPTAMTPSSSPNSIRTNERRWRAASNDTGL